MAIRSCNWTSKACSSRIRGTAKLELWHLLTFWTQGVTAQCKRMNLGRITEFREKSVAGSPGYINGGTYLFEPRVVELIAKEGPVSVERSVLPALCPDELYGFPCHGYFIDIGIPQDYQRAQNELRGLSWL